MNTDHKVDAWADSYRSRWAATAVSQRQAQVDEHAQDYCDEEEIGQSFGELPTPTALLFMWAGFCVGYVAERAGWFVLGLCGAIAGAVVLVG